MEPVKFLSAAEVADHLKQRLLDLAFNPHRAWQELPVPPEQDIKLYKMIDLEEGTKCDLFKAVGVVDAPAAVAFDIVTRVEQTDWDDVCKESRVLEEFDSCNQILYFKYALSFPSSARDFCIYRMSAHTPLGYLVAVRSVEHPKAPHRAGTIRAEIHPSGVVTTVHPTDPQKCIVTVVGHLDLKLEHYEPYLGESSSAMDFSFHKAYLAGHVITAVRNYFTFHSTKDVQKQYFMHVEGRMFKELYDLFGHDADNGWKLVLSQKDMTIYLRADDYLNGLAGCLGVYTVEAPPHIVMQTTWENADPMTTIVDVEHIYGPAYVRYFVFSPLMMPTLGDGVILQSTRSAPGGIYMIAFKSVVHNACPEQADRKRTEINISGYIFHPRNGGKHTLVACCFSMDVPTADQPAQKFAEVFAFRHFSAAFNVRSACAQKMKKLAAGLDITPSPSKPFTSPADVHPPPPLKSNIYNFNPAVISVPNSFFANMGRPVKEGGKILPHVPVTSANCKALMQEFEKRHRGIHRSQSGNLDAHAGHATGSPAPFSMETTAHSMSPSPSASALLPSGLPGSQSSSFTSSTLPHPPSSSLSSVSSAVPKEDLPVSSSSSADSEACSPSCGHVGHKRKSPEFVMSMVEDKSERTLPLPTPDKTISAPVSLNEKFSFSSPRSSPAMQSYNSSDDGVLPPLHAILDMEALLQASISPVESPTGSAPPSPKRDSSAGSEPPLKLPRRAKEHREKAPYRKRSFAFLLSRKVSPGEEEDDFEYCYNCTTSYLEALPEEVLLQILSYLRPRDLGRLAQVNRACLFLTQEDYLWKSVYQADFPPGVRSSIPPVKLSLDPSAVAKIEEAKKSQTVSEPPRLADDPVANESAPPDLPLFGWKSKYRDVATLECNWRKGKAKQTTLGTSGKAMKSVLLAGNLAIAGGATKFVNVWNLETGNCTHTFSSNTSGVSALAFDGENVVAGYKNGLMRAWSLSANECVWMKQFYYPSQGFLFAGPKVVSWATNIDFWDLDNGKLLQTMKGHTLKINTVSMNESRLVSGSNDRSVRLWNVETSDCVSVLSGHTGKVTTVDIDHDLIASGGADKVVRLFDPRAAASIRQCDAHTGTLVGVKLLGDRVVSCGTDRLVNVWDLRMSRQPSFVTASASESTPSLHSFQLSSSPVSLAVDEHHIICGTSGGEVWLADFCPVPSTCDFPVKMETFHRPFMAGRRKT